MKSNDLSRSSVSTWLPTFALSFFLNGCLESASSGDNNEAAKKAQPSSGDCMLLSMAAKEVTPEDQSLVPAILSSCPGRYSNRRRTQSEKRAFTETLANFPAPADIMAKGVEVESLYNRLVSKGVPPTLAVKIINETVIA